MRNFAVLLCVSLAACGPTVPPLDTVGISNGIEAAKAVRAVNNAIANATLGTVARDTVASAEFNRACTKAGAKTGNVKGKITGSTVAQDGTPVPSYDLEITTCKSDDYELYGVASWHYSHQSLGSGQDHFDIAISGTLGAKVGAVQGDMTFNDFKVVADITHTGTSVNVDVTVSGSMQVGTKMFTPTQDDFHDVFLQ
jgi:hypothetical protein